MALTEAMGTGIVMSTVTNENESGEAGIENDAFNRSPG